MANHFYEEAFLLGLSLAVKRISPGSVLRPFPNRKKQEADFPPFEDCQNPAFLNLYLFFLLSHDRFFTQLLVAFFALDHLWSRGGRLS